ncbi:MAG TPA: hypothetical protein VNR70_04105 [Steroidobacteraceae bacterium]|jgi:hypothetical protein|nr:hypothetical protein [Steroidobacteraceae bacterium]
MTKRPPDLEGLWQRSMIARPDGTRDTTTRVRWLQGIDAFVDLRQPAQLPNFPHAARLNDLSMADCAALATQEGFAGRLNFDGRHFEWARRIDFQPKSPMADAGSLEWDGEVLVERGRDVDYVEHWHRVAAGVPPRGAVVLREADSGTMAYLLRVGGEFMFARDRATPLPPHRTLLECIAATDTLPTARVFLDCEISAGSVAAEGFRITASTLPFRCGRLLGQNLRRDRVTTADCSADGTAVTRAWDIIESEGDIAAVSTW